MGQSMSFSTGNPIARKINAATSSRAKSVRNPKPTRAIQNRTPQGVTAGSKRGTNQSSVAPATALRRTPDTVGTGAPTAVTSPLRNCRGCMPYQKQYARNRRGVKRTQAPAGRQSSEAIFHIRRKTPSCPKLKAPIPSSGRKHQNPTRVPTISAQASTTRRLGARRRAQSRPNALVRGSPSVRCSRRGVAIPGAHIVSTYLDPNTSAS